MSNINVTEGAGKTVATESVGGLEYQRIEIVSSGAGSVLSINPDGSLQASIIGKVSINPASVSGSVGIVGTPSISGTVTVGNPTASILSMVAPKASIVSAVTSVMTGTGLTSVLSAAGVSIKNYMTHIIVTNGAAVGTFVDIKDGGGNVLYSGYAAASGGGFVANPWPPIVGSANKSVDAQPRVQASIIVAMTGYTDT